MDLVTLAQRSQIEPRRLRYAIYHTLLPGVDRVDVGRGSVRSFTEFEAFGIALAAMLLDAGLKRRFVADCMRVLAATPEGRRRINEVPLYRAFTSRGPVHILVGDRTYVRLRAALAGRTKVFDTGWSRIDVGPACPANYEPVVLLNVNIVPLREALSVAPRA